jgi:glucose-1-phosphate thymidylyltransferase
MKNGILLSGGTGSRLAPLTSVINKHLLGLNGKFIIDYPINTLKSLGCQDVTVILGGEHYSQVAGYLGDGERYGLNINYVYQKAPLGIAHAINLCKRFIYDDSDFSVVLGDNIYEEDLKWNNPDYKTNPKAQIVLADHAELTRFGVASLDAAGQIKKIEEKPKVLDPTFNNMAVTGCYLFTSQFFEYFKELRPSARGEYEITKIIELYLRDGNLSWTKTNALWSDSGTHESIAYLNNYFYNKNHGTP